MTDEPWPGLKLFLQAEYDEREALAPRDITARLDALAAVTRAALDAGAFGALAPGARVLDAGCGSGLFALAAAHAHPEARVTGVDLSAGAVAAASEAARAMGLKNTDFRAADIDALPFEDGTFARVIVGFALNLFPDKGRAFAECKRVLVPGGLLVVPETFRAGDVHGGPGPADTEYVLKLARVTGFREVIRVDILTEVTAAADARAWPWGGFPPRAEPRILVLQA